MIRLYYWLKILCLSAKWVFALNLGDEVEYRGETWVLIQGVRSPYWTLSWCGGTETCEVNASRFRKLRTWRNYIHSFQSGYRFYMGYWFELWCRKGIRPWMRRCNIW